MSDICNNKNPLQRDGTSQAQRLVNALLPSYVLVDERSLADLVAFVQRYASQIKYFNLADAPDGDWVGFFIKSISAEQRTEPHFALLISFLEIFKIAQDDLNTITQRHLDFYYREVLNLHEKPAVPDQVFIIFELAEQLNSALVEKGKELDAKKDGKGVELIYETDKDIVVNHGTVQELKSVFINRPINESAFPQEFPDLIPIPDPTEPVPLFQSNEWRIYSSPVANSGDGIGGDIENEEKRWRTFGRPAPVSTGSSLPDRPQAEVGFAFASPLLFLAEGKRTITIRINSLTASVAVTGVTLSEIAMVAAAPAFAATSAAFSASSASFSASSASFSASSASFSASSAVAASDLTANLVANFNNNALKGAISVYFSGEEEWILSSEDSTIYETNGDLVITRTLDVGKKAVVAYNESVLLQPFKTQWPVVKLVLNTAHSASPYIYQQLSSKAVFTAKLEVNVTEVKNIIVQSEDSVLATEKPFQPFGSQPVVGSTFYIGSNEIFQKHLDEVEVDITWHGLPDDAIAPNGFQDYYKHYIPFDEDDKRATSKFNVDVAILDKRAWRTVSGSGGYGLFNSYNKYIPATNTTIHPISPDIKMSISNILLRSVPRDPNMEPVTEFGATTHKGFLRMTLADVDFGHSIFQNSYARQAIWIAKGTTATQAATEFPNATVGLPNEPYTPTIKEITVNYKSSETINLTRQPDENTNKANYEKRVEQFYHVMPFGVAENHPFITKRSPNINLLPQYSDEGALYIGISALQPPQTLSLLMKVAEGSADPDLQKQKVKWSYMLNNEWYDFSQLQILSDSTNGLLTSGIVSFDLPKLFNSDNTALSSGLFWLRVAVEHNSAAVCDLLNVVAQAVTATFADNANDPDHLRKSLPADTIKDFINSNATIDKISQPYASFGGHIKEQSNEFYRRVSERLRHKNRAITIWDYEHLVLEQFPTIYKVKCLNHTRYTSITDHNEMVPGHVSLVIISDLQNKNAVDPLKPKTSLITLEQISDFIKTINPPYSELHVRNPIFEEIRVEFNVRFHQGFDNGFYGQLLSDEIKQFLAPWAYGTKDIVFGGVIHKSRIINFVEERPYVDFVTCFNMDQIIPIGKNIPPLVRKNIESAETSTSASVLTSAQTHLITVLETDDCECVDNLVVIPILNPDQPCDDCGDKKDNPETGIGADEIGTTFIIGHSPREGIDFWTIEQDFTVQ